MTHEELIEALREAKSPQPEEFVLDGKPPIWFGVDHGLEHDSIYSERLEKLEIEVLGLRDERARLEMLLEDARAELADKHERCERECVSRTKYRYDLEQAVKARNSAQNRLRALRRFHETAR
jgi:hypothetical protein